MLRPEPQGWIEPVVEPQETGRHRILIVDDEEDIRSLLKALVERFGYEAHTAANGEEAFELVRAAPISISSSRTFRCPGSADWNSFRRSAGPYPETDLIAVTGYNIDYRYTDVINVGASDFITKPIDANELQAKIVRVFRERTLREQLRRLTTRDGLTDLYNRRFFDGRGPEEVARALRQGDSLILMLMDIDRFKRYNDTLGHQAGDGLLRKLADVINSSIRSGVDIGFRYGGDEFGVLVPQVSTEQALKIAERIRMKYGKIANSSTSLSIGLAKLIDSGQGVQNSFYDLVKSADDALYSSKKQGGNCVTLYSPETVSKSSVPEPLA
jgi:two-component system cell cycle response regulator